MDKKRKENELCPHCGWLVVLDSCKCEGNRGNDLIGTSRYIIGVDWAIELKWYQKIRDWIKSFYIKINNKKL